MIDVSFNYCYSFRVDLSGQYHYDPKYPMPIVDAVNYPLQMKKFLSTRNVKYYVGKIEVSEQGKPHYQMCLMFDDEPNRQSFMNVKKKKWVAKTHQPVSFTIARSSEKLMSYVTKEEGYEITNLNEDQLASIKPWEKKQKKSIDKYEYILKYTKKLLKDKNIEEYVSVENQQSYNTEYTFFPSESKDGLENKNSTTQEPYEYGDRLDASDKLNILVGATKEYFRKFNIIMTKKTQLKIMIATKMYSYMDYTIDNFHNLFSQYRV